MPKFTDAQAQRMVWRSQLGLDLVVDTRHHRGKGMQPVNGLFSLLVVALAAGRRVLRWVEDLYHDLWQAFTAS